MQLVIGLIFIIVCAGMITVARPAPGAESVYWLKPWPIGQLYVLTTLVFGIVGIGLILSGWPQ